MTTPAGVVSAWCKSQCARYYKKYVKAVNSTETIDSTKNAAFNDWMEE